MVPLELVISLLENEPSYYHQSPHLYLPSPCFSPRTNSPSQVEMFPALTQVSLPIPSGQSAAHSPWQRQPSFQNIKMPFPSACSFCISPSQYHPCELINLPSPFGIPFEKQPVNRFPSLQINLPFPKGKPSLHSLPASQTNPQLLIAQALGSVTPSGAGKSLLGANGFSLFQISMTVGCSFGTLSTGVKLRTNSLSLTPQKLFSYCEGLRQKDSRELLKTLLSTCYSEQHC